MKARAYIIVACFITAGLAHAGFRHPVEETGTEAQQVQNTPHPAAVVTSYSRVMPDRVVSSPAPSQAYGPAVPAGLKPAALPSNVKATPASTAAKAAPAAKSPVPAWKPAPIPTAKPAASVAAVKGVRPEPRKSAGPVPKAPSLPAADRIGIPDVMLPHSAASDGLLTMQPPEKLNLKGLNRPQIHAFLKHARELKVPSREYTKEVRSREVAERFKSALHPEPGKSYRTAYKLSLAKVGKIQQPPSVTQYENMVKRIDSLFEGLDLRYPLAVKNLWELAESPTNARDLQARDALFAGLLSTRAGWETTAAMMYEEAAAKRVEREDRYVKILWNQLETVQNPVHLDKIVAAVSPIRVRDASPAGDQANYALAKRLLLNRHHAPLALYPSHEVFQQRIASRDLRDKLSLLALVGQLRSKQESRRQAAVGALRVIESTGSYDNSQQARLALARTMLQHGAPAEALALYRNVAKDRKNRLAVLGEQTYAEYVNGEYQDALGKTVALETPSFQYGFAPDVHLVEIMTRKAMCDFGGAEAGVKRFAERYVPELNALDETLKHKADPAAYYEELVGAASSENPHRFQRYLLQLPAVMGNQKTMNQALTELAKLDALGTHQKTLERPEGWDGFTASMRARWTNRAAELRRESARAALTEVGYLAQRLRHTFGQVELLDLDISTAAAKNYNIQSALNFPAQKQEQAQLDEHKMRWPFESELWEDEIDFMKAKNPSKCAVTKTAAL